MAAEDVKGKKRKGATETAPQAKKARKSDDVAAAAKPTKASKPAKSKPARKEAADLFDKEEVVTEEPAKPTRSKKTKAPVETNGDAMDIEAIEATEKPKRQPKKSKTTAAETVPEPVDVKVAKKGKKGKQADPAPVEQDEPAEVEEAAVSKSKAKKGNASKKVEAKEEVAVVPEETEDDVEEDDQTAALLAGFESDDDSDDPEEDLDFDDDVHVPALNAKQRKAIEKAEKAAQSDKPGVIYVGRVPRGFFEPQMKKYFSQFGRVNRLRLSRNKKTGASKHYAFVEFASTEVADIVARTMNNYLLFGHILKCKLIPEDQVHVNLFKGAGQRFKVDPRNKKAGLDMERGVERSRWEKRVNEENKRRSGRSKALKEQFGYEYNAPEVKSVDDVPKQSALTAAEPQQQLEDAPAEEPKGKKGKKAAKSKAVTETTVDAPEPVPEPAAPVAEKKGKKDKKRKSDVAALEITAVTEETVGEDAAAAPAEAAAPKSKKAKKDTKPAAPAPAVEAEEKPKRKAKAAAVEQAPAAAAAPKAKKAKKAKA